MPELRNRLHVALQNCTADEPACRANLGYFVEDGFQSGVGIVTAFQLPVPADDIVADFRAKILADPHPPHPLVHHLYGARYLRAYVRGALYHACMDWLNEQDVQLPQHGNALLVDQIHLGDPIPILLGLLRTSCDVGDLLVVIVCGRSGQYAEPLPVRPEQIRPEEREALGVKWNEYQVMLGALDNQRAEICALFGVTSTNLAQIKHRGWVAAFSEAIKRGAATPTRHLSAEMVVALIERKLHLMPACLADGRHHQNLPPQFVPHWAWIQDALLTATFDWSEVGISGDEAKDMHATGRVQWLEAVLGLDE